VVRPSTSGPPLGTTFRPEYFSFRPSVFCSAPDLHPGPLHRTLSPDLLSGPRLTGPLFRTARVLCFSFQDLCLGPAIRPRVLQRPLNVSSDLYGVTSPDITRTPDRYDAESISFPTPTSAFDLASIRLHQSASTLPFSAFRS
jgi:hypothetical protein